MSRSTKFYPKARKKELHEIWALYVKTRDNFICQWCGKPARDAHHIVPKSVCGNAGRYEVENGMALCFHCHQNRIPTDPDAYILFRDGWLKKQGLDYFEMKASYNGSVKFTQDFFDLKYKVIKDMLDEL
jgi:hypothetical protein